MDEPDSGAEIEVILQPCRVSGLFQGPKFRIRTCSTLSLTEVSNHMCLTTKLTLFMALASLVKRTGLTCDSRWTHESQTLYGVFEKAIIILFLLPHLHNSLNRWL